MEELKKQIWAILLKGDEELIENIYLKAKEQIANDHENPYREGRFFLQAFVDDDPQAMLLALCGWNINSLIIMAEAEGRNNNE